MSRGAHWLRLTVKAKSLAEVKNIKGKQRNEFHQGDEMIMYCIDVLDSQTYKQTHRQTDRRESTGRNILISTLFTDKTKNLFLSLKPCLPTNKYLSVGVNAEIRLPV